MTSKTKICQLEERISEKLNLKIPPVPILWDLNQARKEGLSTENIPLNTGKDKRESWELYFKRNLSKNL